MKNQAFDFSVNVLQALLWQYNDAESLLQIMRAKQAWYDENQTAFWTDWVRDVFDLRTANDFGLGVWAVILETPLSVVFEPDYLTKHLFGYGSDNYNYGNGNYGSRTQIEVPLTTAQKRLVLQLRYFQLISRGNVPQTNRNMAWAFADYGPVYVLDPLDMSEIVYVFGFAIPSLVLFVLTFYDILPRPAGVGVRYVISVRENFGYGIYMRNYERGNYGA